MIVSKQTFLIALLLGTIVLELSKEKHNASLLDRQLNQFQTSINRIENELSSQIRYLTQVILCIPMFLFIYLQMCNILV